MNNKTIVVTGANRGLGLETARQLAEAGHRVVVAARSAEAASKTAVDIGNGASPLVLDVSDSASVQAAAERVRAEFGSVFGVVNNAGIIREFGPEGPFAPSRVSLEAIEETYQTNLLGPIRVIQAFIPLLRAGGGGNIVNVSSGLGSLFNTADDQWEYRHFNLLAYNSSKTALNAVTIAFAKELAPDNIRVNSADPGYCATDINGHTGVRSAAEGGRIAARLATLESDGPTGGFFSDSGRVPW
ncbi:MAG: SDR family NAD(P)-dependent oxidoreductase [Terrimicrobiaceae bacterium]|nr:SDR family NAD(P)-dependent oxidoreductase [Terrimicrobiaceae bacterium]